LWTQSQSSWLPDNFRVLDLGLSDEAASEWVTFGFLVFALMKNDDNGNLMSCVRSFKNVMGQLCLSFFDLLFVAENTTMMLVSRI
jgi:hypothetical protein